ncbi:MAG: DUF4302 domain-containing protein [Porphyromonas sp.]|nr:DUF4302 domain-containing protein [Porphyromonas sp.]
MRRYLLYILSALSLCACSRYEQDVFSQSPGQRFEQTVSEYEQILISQEQGWLMEYYAGSKQSYGGHNIVLRFLNGHQVAAQSEHIDSVYTSQYTIDAVDGGAIPTLTFDTFSEVLHQFAIPTPQDIKGKGGDFEFNLQYQDSIFVLKGKKWGNEIRLRPFKGEAKAYFSALQRQRQALTLAAFTPIVIDGTEVQLSMDLDNRRLSLMSGGTTASRAFILTDRGLKLYSPLKLGTQSIQELVLSSDGTQLSTADGGVRTTLVHLADALNLNKYSWSGYWVEGFASQNFLDKFGTIRSEERSIFSGNYTSDRAFTLGKGSSWTGLALSKTSHRDKVAASFPVGYLMDFYAVPNAPEQIHIVEKTSGKNWKYFSDMYPLISELTKYSPYEVQDVSEGGVAYKKFTSRLEPAVWFYMQTEPTTSEIMTSAWTIDFYQGWMSANLLEVFAASTSAEYKTGAFASLGLQHQWTSLQFSVYKADNSSSYYCNYLVDIVPVWGKPQSVHILDRREGYYFQYFRYLRPIVNKILEASPYELVSSGRYQQLVGVNRDTWIYKHE